MLGFAAGSALAAALCGWLLSQSGDYDPQLLRWHRWAGLALAAACLATLLVDREGRSRIYHLSLAATLALLVVAGHLGASITHGRGFLTRYAPRPLRALLGESADYSVTKPPAADLRQRRVFVDVVQPVFQQRCWVCHAAGKQKANLRLDSLARMLRGGKSGPALVPGKADESLLMRRLRLPLDDDDHMPPNGKPQLTAAEVELLQWWINAGAPTNGLVQEVPGGEELPRLLTSSSGDAGADRR